MKKLDIYLDTSIWNYLFADDTPEKKELTVRFFKKVKAGGYNIYISPTVTEEISKTKNEKKLKLLLNAIGEYGPLVFGLSNEVTNLAEQYIKEGVIPEEKKEDAYHIAHAVCNGVDILLSWNYKHLANIETKHNVTRINIREGYFKELELITPYGLSLEYED